MVTFVCEYCDLTLKKKQIEGHIRGGCSPGAMICIDCSQTFYGNDHKAHVSCISQQQKHWGQFAKVKKTKPISKQTTEVKQETNNKQNKIKYGLVNEQKSLVEEKQVETTVKINTGDEKQQVESKWNGWKKEIKQLLQNNNNRLEKQKLIKKLRKVYLKKGGEVIGQQQFRQIFEEKVKKTSSVKEETFYELQEHEEDQ